MKSEIVYKGEVCGLPIVVKHMDLRHYSAVPPKDQWHCGYVGVPNGHPLYGTDYDAVPGLRVHGGLTFSDFLEGEGNSHWYFGFDCAHAGDTFADWPVERVAKECGKLAGQLALLAIF